MPLYDDAELGLFREYESERYGLTSPTCQYSSLTRGANVDPLYQEQVGWVYLVKSLVIFVKVSNGDDRQIDVDEFGQSVELTGEAFIAEPDWVAQYPDRVPKEGDRFEAPQFGWFDVTGASTAGSLNDTGKSVGYKFAVSRKSKFTPDRRQ